MRWSRTKGGTSVPSDWRDDMWSQKSLLDLWREIADDPAWRKMQESGYLSDRLVPGTGNICADVAFVGEAPGRQEDEQQRPFVGQSGDLLWRMLTEITGLTRESVWTTNVVKFRPRNNVTPGLYEARLGARYLKRELEIVRPRIVVTLGSVPLRLVTTHGTMTERQGNPFTLPSRPWTYLPMFHPAYMLRRRDLWPVFKEGFHVLAELLQEDNHDRL